MLSCSIIRSYTAIGMLQGLRSWPCTAEHVLVLGHKAQGLKGFSFVKTSDAATCVRKSSPNVPYPVIGSPVNLV